MVKQHTSSGGSAKLLVAKDLAVRHLEAHITRGMHLRRQKLQNLQDLEKARAVKQAWVTGYTTLLKRLFEGNAVADACNDWVGKIFPEYAHPNLFIENFYEEIDQRLQRLQAVAERVTEMADRVVDVAGEAGMSNAAVANSGISNTGMSGGGMSSGGMANGGGMSNAAMANSGMANMVSMNSGMPGSGMPGSGMPGGSMPSAGVPSVGMQNGMANGLMANAPMAGGMPNGGMSNGGMGGGSRMDAMPMQPQTMHPQTMHPQTHAAEHDAEEEEQEAPPVRYTQPPMSHGPSHGHPQVLGRGNGQGPAALAKNKPPVRLGRGAAQAEQVSIIARGLLVSVAEQDVAGAVVKKFLADMGVDLVLLNAPASGGEELIAAVDTVEKANNVSFALVSVGDDEAATRFTDDVELQDGSAVDRIAIFLMGVLVGKMGLKRVCMLHPSGSNPTADPSGLTHVAIDESGGWQLQLARQLKRAGVHLDLNRLF
jgi:predicted nucleotide-binding protein